jgi:hypothetical protein
MVLDGAIKDHLYEGRFEKKLSCWIGKMLSYGDHLVLINSVLTSLPMFMLSFLQIPKGVRKERGVVS